MTKQLAIETIENNGAKVLACRMEYGKPKVTINWRDYGKIRNLPEVVNGTILIAMR